MFGLLECGKNIILLVLPSVFIKAVYLLPV